MKPHALLLAALLPAATSAQVFVYPRVPDKSHVRYAEFEWRHVDILVGPEAEGELMDESPHEPGRPRGSPQAPAAPERPVQLGSEQRTAAEGEKAAPVPVPAAGAVGPSFAKSLDERAGGVRLYFYDREQEVAERAAASITETYRYLVEQFRYVPTKTFPYILYSSYQEFLQTNLFPIQEGVLGVTSPRDLKLTLPYLGDHRMFEEISTHEMAHQFTIQKVRTLAEPGKLADPLEQMPLWFIEGLAEFYAQRGTPPEAEMLVRDILLNPALEKGYALLDFFEDRPFSVLWTYRAGNVRCAFLEDVYGNGFLQRVLDGSVRLVAADKVLGPRVPDFAGLLEKLTGDNRRAISAKFEEWLKRRAYRTYLDSEQDAADFTLLPDAGDLYGDITQALTSSPDGEVLLYRAISPETGDSRLWMVHRGAPVRPMLVTVDGVPGVESLHPISPRSFDLGTSRLVFIAESRARDVLYVQDYEARVLRRTAKAGEPLVAQVRLKLGPRRAIALGEMGLVAAYSPALSPDGKQVAFVGLTQEGVRDVFAVEVAGTGLRRLTNDDYSERQLSWGPSGVVFTSDATAHGRYNLFLWRPAEGDVERLTTEERDEHDPRALPDGRVIFVAYSGARADLHELSDGKVVRRTNVVTGVYDPSPGPDGGVWTLLHRSGQRKPVLVEKKKLLSGPAEEQLAAAPARELSKTSLEGAQPYRPFSLSNWELGPVFGIVGGGPGGIVGQLLALSRDRLGNHALLLDLSIFGSFELTDGYLLYINQERRITYGGGAFQSLRFREDKTFSDLPVRFFSGERFFGATASVRYPLNRFVYAQTDLAVGGAVYFLLPLEQQLLALGELNGTGEDRLATWLETNSGTRLQTEGTLRLGYDTVRYHPATGPLAGSALLLEGTVAVQPQSGLSYGSARVDAGRYFPLAGRTNFFLRAGAGATFGGRLAREFFLSSFDTLRGVRFGDINRLLGRNFLFSTAELQLPLNQLVQVAVLTDLEGIIGVDFGGVGRSFEDGWDRRVLNGVVGFNFGMGPLLFRLHFAKNVGIGAPAGMPVPPNEWVTNFSIGIAGLGGLLGDRPALLRGRHALRDRWMGSAPN